MEKLNRGGQASKKQISTKLKSDQGSNGICRREILSKKPSFPEGVHHLHQHKEGGNGRRGAGTQLDREQRSYLPDGNPCRGT